MIKTRKFIIGVTMVALTIVQSILRILIMNGGKELPICPECAWGICNWIMNNEEKSFGLEIIIDQTVVCSDETKLEDYTVEEILYLLGLSI